MPINVRADPELDDRINDIRLRTGRIVNEEILPREHDLWAWRFAEDPGPDDAKRAEAAAEEVEAIVKREGLWAPHLRT
jgi:acyl-CoA dehydrogenase